MSARLTSIRARMRSAAVSLESPATCSTISGGMSIFCKEKYWHRSANRAFLCQLILVRRQGVQALFVFTAVFNWTERAARLELVQAPSVFRGWSPFVIFQHVFELLSDPDHVRTTRLLDCGFSPAPPEACARFRSTGGANAFPVHENAQAVVPAH